jgi:hypothetical protein
MKPTVRLAACVSTAFAASLLGFSAAAAQQSDAHEPASQTMVGAPVTLQALALGDGVDIDLDGGIDEDVWARAIPITDFTQQEPVEGGIPSEETEIRVVYDQDNLYIGVIVYDDPAGVLAYQRERDAGLNTDDRFMWILDTFRDGRTGYFFEINAAGLMGDGILTGGGGGGGFGGPGGGGGGGGGGFGGGTNKAWDGIWEARTQMRPDGWSAEIRIPFRTLNFDPSNEEWGINFQRTIRRKNEEILWRGHRRREGLRSPVYAGLLTGLRNLSQGLGLEARPSTVASWQRSLVNADPLVQPREMTSDWPTDLSLDVNYSVTSSLRASVSVNTDFAEVESDQRRVNLTRFALRFPERRDFFLEGSGVFSFAPSSGPSPFYSRNIGISDGQQVPIHYGARMTGQVGAFEVGFYQLGTGDETYFDVDAAANVDLPSESFTVARVKRQIFEQSSIGAIYTRRSAPPTDAGFASEAGQTAGVDMTLNTRRFLGDNNLEMEAFLVWNSNLNAASSPSFGDLTARGFRLDFPNDIWSGHVSYREFGQGYDPALGFVTRNNFRRLEPRIGWSPRPSISWIRNLDFSTQWRSQWQLGTGLVEEQEIQFKVLGVNFESGDGFDVDVTRSREFLEEDFEISEGVILAGNADYAWWDTRIGARTAGRRRVSLFGNLSFGQFWDGDQVQYGGRVTFRPNPGISLSTNLQVNDVSLPAGAFTASVYELEAQWNPNPWVALTNQLQYDDQSELVGLFTRLRWIVTPGSDVYLVYSHNWQNIGAGDLFDRHRRDLVTLSRGASVKVNYTYRF